MFLNFTVFFKVALPTDVKEHRPTCFEVRPFCHDGDAIVYFIFTSTATRMMGGLVYVFTISCV